MRLATWLLCTASAGFLAWIGSELLTGGGAGPETGGADEALYRALAFLFAVSPSRPSASPRPAEAAPGVGARARLPRLAGLVLGLFVWGHVAGMTG